MELKDFITETLTGIVEGVSEAQKRVEGMDAHINPGGLSRAPSAASADATWDNRNNNYARTVSFDVALEIQENAATNARVGVVAGVFNLGAGGASENRRASAHRVQFSVPVLFPASQLPLDARIANRMPRHEPSEDQS